MEIIKGTAKKPVSAQRLEEIFRQEFSELEGVLYVGYPVLSSSSEPVSIDTLLISKIHGVVAINLVEGKDDSGFGELQDDVANLLEAKFKQHKPLRQGRKLLAVPETLTYAPMIKSKKDDEGHRLVNDSDIVDSIVSIEWESPKLYETVLSVIQSISTIRSNRRRRASSQPGSHGAALQALEDSIANLDARQSKAVIETVEGVQRIRGLAGSGKTIVLALKAAYLHAQNPDWKIAVTFNTRSLKDQFNRLIETFVAEQIGELPNDNLSVLNAWGAPGGPDRTGVYYQFCLATGATYHDFKQARDKFGYKGAFSGVVESALSEVKSNSPKDPYDVILVDEAQDFDSSFLRLCHRFLKPKGRLVYAYDELQSLTDSSLPAPEEIFGVDAEGKPLVIFDGSVPSQDIILEKCYRNSRPVLASAHALGFGIYREPEKKLGTGLTQMFGRAGLWTDVGYEVLDGKLEDDHPVTLDRSESASPKFLEKPGEIEDLILFKAFDDEENQAKWVANQIIKNLFKDELRPDDIIVVNSNLDLKNTAKQVGVIRKILFENNVASHLAEGDVFFQPDARSVAFTGIFRAKGNEAGMVYVINAQDCYSSSEEILKARNTLFTAMTRSKAWVRVVGYGDRMEGLIKEYKRIEKNKYKLNFIYPNKKLRERLRVVNRDMSAEEKKKVKNAKQSMSSLVSDLSTGDVKLDDFPEKDLETLRKILRVTG